MTETTTTEQPGPSFRLIYRSHSRLGADHRGVALAEIFRVARHDNKAAGITGALLVTDHWFVQVLEGEESAVRGLFERIRQDPRHENVTLVEAEPEATRAFSRWEMAQVSASGQADIPVHAVEGEIHPAAPEPVTREQAALLKLMRDTIGADVV